MYGKALRMAKQRSPRHTMWVSVSGRPLARMLVEHDNPRARVLYERLGYSDAGATLDSWPVAGGRTYVTACTIMERTLAEVQGDDAPAD